MSLEQGLRTLLGDRAEAVQAPMPDIEALRRGGLVRRRRRRLAGVALPTFVLVAAIAAGLEWSHGRLDSDARPSPVGQPVESFVGRWTSTDADGSSQTMTIRPSVHGEFEMVLRDDHSGPCAGPSTDTGTGEVEGGELVITGITMDCTNGRKPNGRKPNGRSESLTFVHLRATDTLADYSGVLWSRILGPQNHPRVAQQPTVSFVGHWTSTDLDGSSQTMTIRERSDAPFEMVLRDDFSGPCSGPSTDTGTGAITAGELVITGIVTVCQGGGVPVGAANSLTFHRAGGHALRDNAGVVWSRE